MVMQSPFVWGQGGQALTPEQVARKRELAELARGRAGDTSPVGHWTQGAARVVDALGGVLNERRADRAEAEGLASADEFLSENEILAGLLGGGSAPSPSMPMASGSAPSIPAEAGAIREGLIGRGLPEHVADAFILNFQDESGLNPGINEIEPLVEGSRGGFGLSQWTGPRRKALEQFAVQRGAGVDDLDTQLDFLMYELQGPEAAAAQDILSAPDTGTAAAAIVNKFLRPAEEHRARREARYLGGAAPVQQQGSPEVIAALSQGMSNPWVAQKYGPVLEALMGQQMQRGNMAYEQQLAQQDPMYQAKLAQLTTPEPTDPFAGTQVINGQLVTMGDQGPQVIGDYRDQTPEGENRYRPVGGQIWDFAPESGGAPELVGGGTEEVVFDANGNPIFVRGATGTSKRLTETQAKDNVFATRAEGALRALEAGGADTLASRRENLLDAVPLGIGREAQSPEYQTAQNQGNEFLQAILRKDTGAAITEQEQQLYGDTYLPRPGDSPAVLEVKKQARARAVEALKTGMTPEQIATTERALVNAARRAEGPTPDGGGQSPAPGGQAANPYTGITPEEFAQIDISKLTPEQLDQLFEAMEE